MKACGIEYVARNGEVFVYAAAISKAVKYRRSSTISNYVMRRYISPKGAPKREFENMHMHYGYFTLTELKKMGFKKDAFGKPITNENATLKQDIISLRFLEEVISSSTYKYYAAVTNIIDCIKKARSERGDKKEPQPNDDKEKSVNDANKLKQLDLFQLKSVGKPTNTLRGES